MNQKFCTKVAYKNADHAKEARKTLIYNKRLNGKFENSKIYKCPNCWKYHLTTTGY